jgi:radical SAM-linked protein
LKAQRLRFRYRLTAEAGVFSSRELVRLWEDAVTKAGFPVSHSQGKRPSPQIAIAAPLPLGVTSDCELVDVFLSKPASPNDVLNSLRASPPGPGLEPVRVEEVGVDSPSLQSQICWAEFEATLGSARAEVETAAKELLSASTRPAELQRASRVKHYDLRPLVISLRAEDAPAGGTLLVMRVRAAPETTARADQVIAALGLPAADHIHRTRLEVQAVPEVLLEYRKRGVLEEDGAQ